MARWRHGADAAQPRTTRYGASASVDWCCCRWELPRRSSAHDLPKMREEDFIKANARLMAPPLVPEITLHLASEVVALWRATEEELDRIGLPPPYWAFAWAGGQALARYVLDH